MSIAAILTLISAVTGAAATIVDMLAKKNNDSNK